MAIVSLIAELEAATSLPDLAARLGSVCLAEERLLAGLYDAGDAAPQRSYLEGLVAAIDYSEWQAMPQGGFKNVLDAHELRSIVEHMSMYSPVEHLAFLRGLCRNALTVFFEQTEDVIPLVRGLPVCFATRPINTSFEATTPFQRTLGNRGLLRGLGYEFFRYADAVRVSLDYRHRDRLDAITWTDRAELPCVATLHPSLGDGQLEFTVSEGRFFDVQPKQWSLEDTLAWLRSVRHHQIAVLPELCLPSPDALAASLRESPSDYPPIVVAGSAHVRMYNGAAPIRANESHTYLDGEQVYVHRKIHPLKTHKLGHHRFEEHFVEDLTQEPKDLIVLSGEHTRMAVVICADLNDSTIPTLLEGAGVNLLITPALTYSAGGFNGTVCALASRCQAVCVIVNASLEETITAIGGKNPSPFLMIAGVPRPEPGEQSQAYRAPSGSTLPRGVFDPNLGLDRAMRWEALDESQDTA